MDQTSQNKKSISFEDWCRQELNRTDMNDSKRYNLLVSVIVHGEKSTSLENDYNQYLKSFPIENITAKEKIEYLIYIKGDEYPIFVWATEYEQTETFHRFLLYGNYSVSFPVHQITKIEIKV